MYRQISELCGQTVMDVVAQIKAEPFGAVAGIYNIKTHLQQMQNLPAVDLLWSSVLLEPTPSTPPEYKTLGDLDRSEIVASSSKAPTPPLSVSPPRTNGVPKKLPPKTQEASTKLVFNKSLALNPPRTTTSTASQIREPPKLQVKPPELKPDLTKIRAQLNPFFTSMNRPVSTLYGMKKPIFKVYDSGDCGLDPRLPSIDEHSNTDLDDPRKTRSKVVKTQYVKKVSLEDERPFRLNSCPNRVIDTKRSEFYRRAGDGLPRYFLN